MNAHYSRSSVRLDTSVVSLDRVCLSTEIDGASGRVAALWAWRVPDPDLEPELTLCRWQVIETKEGSMLLIGHCVERLAARISTEVREFELVTMRVTTVSGRVYRLEGPSSADPDATVLWQVTARARELVTWKDVSGEIWKKHQGSVKHLQGDASDHVPAAAGGQTSECLVKEQTDDDRR